MIRHDWSGVGTGTHPYPTRRFYSLIVASAQIMKSEAVVLSAQRKSDVGNIQGGQSLPWGRTSVAESISHWPRQRLSTTCRRFTRRQRRVGRDHVERGRRGRVGAHGRPQLRARREVQQCYMSTANTDTRMNGWHETITICTRFTGDGLGMARPLALTGFFRHFASCLFHATLDVFLRITSDFGFLSAGIRPRM